MEETLLLRKRPPASSESSSLPSMSMVWEPEPTLSAAVVPLLSGPSKLAALPVPLLVMLRAAEALLTDSLCVSRMPSAYGAPVSSCRGVRIVYGLPTGCAPGCTPISRKRTEPSYWAPKSNTKVKSPLVTATLSNTCVGPTWTPGGVVGAVKSRNWRS
ncbi:MAG TPA: hypothetical protein VGM03_19105 [Phycisphaerae bacterium]